MSTRKSLEVKISTIDTDNMTDGSGYYRPGQNGQTYPAAYIDFQNLGNGFTLADLASALVNTTSTCYDFHYIQYAADGSKFYSYDNRESTGPATNATFDTKPYVAIDTGVVNIKYQSDDNTKSIDAQYNYNYKDIISSIHVKMIPDGDCF